MAPRGSSSRQKSCNGCVRSKRRCDQRLPACSNCTKKRRLCIYGRQSDTRLHSNPAGVSTGLDSLDSSLPMSYGDSLILDDSGARTAIESDVDIPLDDTIQLDDTFESLLDSINGNEFNDMLGPSDFVRQDTQIVSIPRTDTPSWILQLFSVCVLYANQTEATRGLVLKILHKNVQDLITTGNIVSLTPREKLARVHALIAYQTIRMLDGDVSLGQQADNDVTLLEAWNGELCKMRDNLEDMAELDATAIPNKPPESWERWLFAESVRRTYMICAALIHFWGLLKGRRIACKIT
ncbi:hypothetical protein Daesc_010222 [Daldinia eschscholtzii]|uniref:Zn(2)-C6 fungal-type domain-containing protein n=1 Tax=Daldinia eschscholtzii TaxID=292717 RepID=A0AAX6M7R6_9PEZI